MTIKTRKRRSISDHSVVDDEAPAVVRLWMLRCLVPLHGFRGLVQKDYLENDDVARVVGLENWVDRQGEEFNQGKVIAELRARHREIERVAVDCHWPETLGRNIRRMADLIGLNAIEQAVLAFAVMIHSDNHLVAATGYLGDHSLQQLYASLSSILCLPEAHVRNAFSSRSVLSRSGLVKLDRDSCFDLKNRLDVISGNFVDIMLGEEADPIELLRGKVEVASRAALTLADYPHLDTPLDLLVPYLKQVLRESRAGVNIFPHGPPGTGKSQLARVLAAEVGCELFEVAGADEDGDPLDAEKRLRAVRAGQCFFASREAMIVFDEAEDVFSDGGLMRDSTARSHKAWMNRLLEGNAVPTQWLSNRVDDMDPAFIRRFDIVVEVPVPPRAQRERIVRALCADAVEDGVVRRLARRRKSLRRPWWRKPMASCAAWDPACRGSGQGKCCCIWWTARWRRRDAPVWEARTRNSCLISTTRLSSMRMWIWQPSQNGSRIRARHACACTGHPAQARRPTAVGWPTN